MFAFNERLINLIEECIPKKKDQLSFLMDTISLGKETAYRRLRGEIPFTFSEVCAIADKLGMSLDSLIKSEKKYNSSFELEISLENPLDYVDFKLAQHEKSYKFFLDLSNMVIGSVFSVIPYSYLLPYEQLFRFYLFKMVYQMASKSIPQDFADFILPESINNRRMYIAKENTWLSSDVIILDRCIFTTFWMEIKYFFKLGFIDEQSIEILRSELLKMVAYYENVAAFGENEESLIYLSNMALTCNYTYVRGDNFERAYIDGIYMMNTISSSDPMICRLHQDWIDSLKRFSTLISISGEIERKAFFNEQRRIINEL